MDENQNQNADVGEQLLLIQTLTDIIGLTAPQANFVCNQGIRTSSTLARLDDDSFKELMERPTLSNIINTTKMRFRALRNWLQEKRMTHEEIDLGNFDNDTCDATLDQMARSSSFKGESKRGSQKDIKPPEKFNGRGKSWKNWKAEFEAFLAQISGADGCPLSYVIRDDDDITADEYALLEGQMKKVYDQPLQGDYFERDNFQVFQKLRALVTGGLAETYLSDYEKSGNGRQAWFTLLTAYEGDDAKNAQITSARNDIRTTTWERNSKNWTFDQYCLKHIQAHNILKRYEVPMDEPTKVREFIRGIHNASLQSVKISILNNEDTKKDLNKAITVFKDTVTTLDLVIFDKTTDDRKIGATQSYPRVGHRGGNSFRGGGGRGGRGHNHNHQRRPHEYRGGHQGRGGGGYQSRYSRGGRGGGGGRYQNNYQNNTSREDDGLLLDQSILSQMNPRQRAAYFEGRKKMRGNDVSDNQSLRGEIPRNVGAIITAEEPQNHPDDSSRITSASAAFGRSSDQHSSNRSINNRRQLGAIESGTRRVSSVNATPNVSIPEDYAFRGRAEIDTRADTTCAGAAFALLETTGVECDVRGFHDEMAPIRNVPIATCATAYDHPALQETLILLFHETLYFGKAMDHSLLNPNQLRDNGLTVDCCPRQYDKSSMHAIYFPEEDLSLPFQMHGCISYLPTRLPTTKELEDCRYIEMTSERKWDPYSDDFQDIERPLSVKLDIVTNICDSRNIYATTSVDRRCDIDAQTLATRLGISHYVASETLKCTTQLASRTISGPFNKRLRTHQSHVRYPRINDFLYSDTFFASVPSKPRNHTCAQLFVTSKGFCEAHPMKTKGDAGDKLNTFITNTGIPLGLITDGAKEENLGKWEEVRKKFLLPQRTTEKDSSWQNHAEREIGETKNHYRRIMDRKQVPEALWDFGITYTTDIRKIIARPTLDNRSAYEVLTGNTPDISEFLDFEFYQWVKYFEPVAFPASREYLGRWLGKAHGIGQALCYYILKENGQIIARSTVRKLTEDEFRDENEAKAREDFDKNIVEKIGTFNDDYINFESTDELEEEMTPSTTEDPMPTPSTADTPDVTHGPDMLINAQVILPRGDRNELATVKHRKRNTDGNLIGRKHRIPSLDSRIYVCEFPDGETCDICYNTIAEHIYSQCDVDGNRYQIFREIINHRRNKNAIDKADQMIQVGNKIHKKKTLAGWDLQVEWKDGSTSWLTLKDLKNSNSVDVAEYAKANRIDQEPAFDWWIHDVLKRRDRLIKMAHSHRLKTGYKFGIQVPDTVEEAIEIDTISGNTLWQDAISKEMQNVYVAFDVRSETQAPPGYKLIPHRIIFEVKMDFTRKARLVAGGHKTDPPAQLTYSSVVSRESVRIGFLMAALYDIEPLAADIGNAYLNKPTKEKYYIVTGPEFGELERGKIAIIVRALYGLKSSGAMWRTHFAATLRDLGFISSLADPDVWMRPSQIPNGDDYYEYILVYVDDLLVISHRGNEILDTLTTKYKYRLKDVGPPSRYLGAIVGRYDKNGTKTWYLSAKDYLQKAIPVVEEHYGTLNKYKADTPLPSNYHPEDDQSAFLKDDEISLYQSFIGTLRWAVELGRIELTFAVSLMSRFTTAPRTDHMQKLLHMFSYIKRHLDSKLVFDPFTRDWSHINFLNHDWNDFYPDAFEPMPSNAPEPRGKAIQINMFCDAAHANDHVTRRSTTGVIIFLQGTPILW
eukprot:CAMPEP_0172424146 /NCGR_PEP_ID=MMETSP1064-20121228/21716_1 /TAXON_ID=202472 /ORGANISM="Aulacoseira subarctica , Strain CCAP 1002/5" /LENGTH=1711 /DNA_ID=CAMNT_0013165931 /DNA_START=811 /DNA_END=5943 /DNA_ORIENTATION=-